MDISDQARQSVSVAASSFDSLSVNSPVVVIQENVATLYAANYHMMEKAEDINPC